MIKENKKKLIITSIVILLPMIVGVFLWNVLPDKIPTHWDASGQVDGWSSKAFAVFGLPAVLFVVHWVCVLATSADPKKKNIEGKVFNIVFWICPVISVLVAVLNYGTALGVSFPTDKIMLTLVGVVFIVIGNYLPKCKQSYTVGIKLPWTLHDEKNWNLTHRMAGKLWVASGFMMLLCMLLPAKVMSALVVAVLFLAVIAPAVYSYRLYRKKGNGGE